MKLYVTEGFNSKLSDCICHSFFLSILLLETDLATDFGVIRLVTHATESVCLSYQNEYRGLVLLINHRK